MKLHHFAVVVASTVLATACGVEQSPDETGTTSEELQNAPVDYRHKWSVGVCSGPLNTDPAAGPIGACLQGGTRCTGSLIAPNLVLTARHCVHEIDYSNATSFCTGTFAGSTPVGYGKVNVTTSLSVIQGNPTWYEVERVLVPTADESSCSGDLAVLKLKRNIPLSVARPVLVDLRELTTHKPNKVAVVGRGAIDQLFDTTDYSVISQDNGGLKRRVLENIPFICVSNTAGVCVSPDIGAPFDVDPGYFQFGEGPLSGDSGAGVVRQWSFSIELPLVIGVNSAGTVDPVTGVPNFSFGTRLDKHRAFIRSVFFNHSPFSKQNLIEND